MEFFDSLLNLYDTNYEVSGAIQAIGFLLLRLFVFLS